MNKNMEKVKHLLNNYKYSIEYAGMNGRNSLIFHITGDKLIEFLDKEFSLFVNYRDPDNIHIDTDESCIAFLYHNKNNQKAFDGSYFVTIPREDLNHNKTFYISLVPLFGIVNNILFFNDIKDLKHNIYDIDDLPYNYNIENEIWNLDGGLIFCDGVWFNKNYIPKDEKELQLKMTLEQANQLFQDYNKQKKQIYNCLKEKAEKLKNE